MNEPRKKILVIGMVDSVHVARWLSQFDQKKYEFRVFASSPNRSIHEILKKLKLGIYPFRGLAGVVIWALDLFFDNRVRGWLLGRLINKFNPEFVHVLEFQHAGYIFLRASRHLMTQPKVILSNYGSDIYWFSQFPKHQKKITQLLALGDRYSAECRRDIELAIKFGFVGEFLPVIPNSGGMIAASEGEPPSQRQTILVKGYDGWVGRATNAIAALDAIPQIIRGYQLVFYSCNYKTTLKALSLARRHKLDVKVIKKRALSHVEMLQLFELSRIHIGISLSDGISTALLESMAHGTFPIQSSTSCCNEWIESGKSGFIVNPLEISGIATAISNSLVDDNLVDSAALINRKTVINRTEPSKIRDKAELFYA